MAYLRGLYQLAGCPIYTGDIVIACTCLKIVPIYNNTMLGAAQFMVDFQGMHFNAKKALYVNFQKHASIFCKAMLSTINGGGHGQFYVLPTRLFSTTNNYFPMEERYSGLIYQHALENIINEYQGFIKFLHQPTKTRRLVGQFPNIQKEKNTCMVLLMLLFAN